MSCRELYQRLAPPTVCVCHSFIKLVEFAVKKAGRVVGRVLLKDEV